MSPELIQEIKTRVAQLEPDEQKLWAEVQRLEVELKQLKKPSEAATSAWLKVHRELEHMKAMLPNEEAQT